MRDWTALLFASALFVSQTSALGCMKQVCAGNEDNKLRSCPDRDGSCGHYKGARSDKVLLPAVDLRCDVGKEVYAPIPGTFESFSPFGRSPGKSLCDSGLRIVGTGQWQGYVVSISSIEPYEYSGTIEAGKPIGTALDRLCHEDESQKAVEPHIQIRVQREGIDIDPTNHLQNCMCTGQICESNSANKLLSDPFKFDPRYDGVKGWDLECRRIPDEEVEGDGKTRAPAIYSPVQGNAMLRARLHFDPDSGYTGCDNDAIIIKGDGLWMDYEVKIFNAKYRDDMPPGEMHVVQGQHIGERLSCDNSPDSVYMEVRHQGKVVDITKMISAEDCKMPHFTT